MAQDDVLPKRAPMQPQRPGETQLGATRRVLRESGLNAAALAAINEANAEIDAQARGGSGHSKPR